MTEVSTIGSTIKELRTRSGMSQRDLAEAAGVSGAFLSLVERGEREASLAVVGRIADALEVSRTALFWRFVPRPQRLSARDRRLCRIADALASDLLKLDGP